MKPSLMVLLGLLVAMTSAGVLVTMVAAKGGTKPSAWFTASEDDSTLQKVWKALTSVPILSLQLVIVSLVVIELVAPSVYEEWYGGEHGWALFIAALIAMPIGTRLIMSKKWALAKGGIVLIIIGYILPLIIATTPGQTFAQKYEDFWNGHHSITLEPGVWKSVVKKTDTKIPGWLTPEKGTENAWFVFKNKDADGRETVIVQGPKNQSGTTVAFQGERLRTIWKFSESGVETESLRVTVMDGGPKRIRILSE
jgi:hypothetical protein